MPKNLKTAEQIAIATEELRNKRVAAGVTNRLWVHDGGECVCDDHAGNYLTAGITSKPKASTHRTPLGTWHAEVVRLDLMDELNEDLYCEVCFKGLFPVYPKLVVPAPKPVAPKPAKPAEDKDFMTKPRHRRTSETATYAEVLKQTGKTVIQWDDVVKVERGNRFYDYNNFVVDGIEVAFVWKTKTKTHGDFFGKMFAAKNEDDAWAAMHKFFEEQTAKHATKTEVASSGKKFFVWSDGEKSVCAKHMGPILKKAVAEAPRKRKHVLSNGEWAKVEETGDNVCGRCLKMAKGKTSTKTPATKGKKELKKPAKKGTEQFYAIRFGDGYYMASYSSREMDYTVAFSEARRFKTYDGAEKIINRMREEYDAEDLTPLISVMRVTIDHDDRTKTRAQRMGVLAF